MQTPQAETTGFRFPTHFPPSTHPRGLPSALSFVDTQPDNIMLVRDPDFPGGERVKLLDFGIAKMAEHLSAQPVRTKSDVLMGTPTYMAPEQCRGAKLATDRSDVYSLGVILYQMLAGQPPFLGASMGDLIAMHLMDAPQPLTELVIGLNPKIWRLVRALLAKKPSDRPPMEKVHKTLLALEEETKADPSEVELTDADEPRGSDSQHATIDVPGQRALQTASAETSNPKAKGPHHNPQIQAQLDLPSAIVSDSRHIHVPRRTLHLLIGALATSAVIVTTGILFGMRPDRRNSIELRRVENAAATNGLETAATTNGTATAAPSPVDAGTSSGAGNVGKNPLNLSDRRDGAKKIAEAAHVSSGKPRSAGAEETSAATPSAVHQDPAPVPAVAPPDLATAAVAIQPAPNPQVAPEHSARPVAVATNKPADDEDDEPEQPKAKDAPSAAAKPVPSAQVAPVAGKPAAADDPFDPLKTADDYLLQGSYRRAMDLATQFGKQDPMRAWEIFGRAACGLRSLDRASRALRELQKRQETRRIQSLLDYCRLHKIILPDAGG